MTLPNPIRYDHDTWLCMRNDPVLPAAIITRQQRDGREYFRVVTWALERGERRLVGRYPTLDAANDAVNYPRPSAATPPIPASMLPVGHPGRIASGFDG